VSRFVLLIGMLLLLAGCATTGSNTVGKQEAGDTATLDPQINAAYAHALDAMRDGDKVRAEAALRQLLEKYPQFSGPRANLGILYFRANNMKQAKREFELALKVNAENVVSLNHLGIISRAEGRFEDAFAFYEKALKIKPDYAYAHLNFGILLDLYMGKLNEALTHYQRYQMLSEKQNKVKDKNVANWIIDLKRRIKK
jgi:lipoprotein NlpI